MKCFRTLILFAITFQILQLNSQTINWGSLENYSIYTTGNINANERVIVLNGDIAADGTISNNFLFGTTHKDSGDQEWSEIQTDLNSLINTLNNLEADAHNGSFSNTTISPGVYDIESSAILTGIIIFDGTDSDEYIFNIDGDLDFSDMTLLSINDVNPSNII